MPNYKVIKDTREQDGWFFYPYDKCIGMDVKKLNTGDYTIDGFEDVVCIERKACVSEIALNLGKNKDTFLAEMKRMKDYEFSFLICEFDMEDILRYPEGSRIPKAQKDKVKVTGKYILKCLNEFQIYYNTKIILCGNKNNAFLVCNSIFKRLNELFHKQEKGNETAI